MPPLTQKVPVRTRSATGRRSSDPENTPPESPYTLSLAIRTASSSSSKGITDEDRPEIALGDRHGVVEVG